MRITSQQFREMEARLMPKASKSSDAFAGKESELHRMIEDDLRARRWFYVHSRCDRATTQQKGIPDFVIAAPSDQFSDGHPRCFWVEVKKKGGKLTREQTITRHVLTALGHKWACVYSFQEYLDFVNK